MALAKFEFKYEKFNKDQIKVTLPNEEREIFYNSFTPEQLKVVKRDGQSLTEVVISPQAGFSFRHVWIISAVNLIWAIQGHYYPLADFGDVDKVKAWFNANLAPTLEYPALTKEELVDGLALFIAGQAMARITKRAEQLDEVIQVCKQNMANVNTSYESTLAAMARLDYLDPTKLAIPASVVSERQQHLVKLRKKIEFRLDELDKADRVVDGIKGESERMIIEYEGTVWLISKGRMTLDDVVWQFEDYEHRLALLKGQIIRDYHTLAVDDLITHARRTILELAPPK